MGQVGTTQHAAHLVLREIVVLWQDVDVHVQAAGAKYVLVQCTSAIVP